MKNLTNILFLLLGLIIIILVSNIKVKGTFGFLLLVVGIVLIGKGLFKDNNPFKVIAQFFLSYL